MSYAERVNLDALRTKYETLIPILTERSRRLWAATEAMSLGHGGIALVVRATGISRSTISRGWWQRMGRPVYGGVSRLLITADAGGSNSPRTRLWKWELQKFANRTGLSITVCHYPPGTSKWNKIEHRLFSYIAKNWRGKPLVSLSTIVTLGSTTTQAGLRVRSEIDKRSYPKGVTVSDQQMDQVSLKRHDFHGDWNYTIRPIKT